MKHVLTTDMDFLCAKVRGLRGRLYAGPSLLALARLASSAAYYEKVLSGSVPQSHIQGQHSLITAHAEHLVRISRFLSGKRRDAFDWLVRRYQIENLKILLRARAHKLGKDAALDLLTKLPDELSLPIDEILGAQGLKALADAIPLKPVAENLMLVAGLSEEPNFAFYLESAVEQACLTEGLRRISLLRRAERGRCIEIIETEILAYNILLLWRGLKTYSINPGTMQNFVIRRGPFSNLATRLRAFETDDISALPSALGVGKILGDKVAGIATVEDLENVLQTQLYRTAKRLFAKSMFDFGLIVAYFFLKRFELQDLIRLSEAIRQSLGPEEARTHLVTVN